MRFAEANLDPDDIIGDDPEFIKDEIARREAAEAEAEAAAEEELEREQQEQNDA